MDRDDEEKSKGFKVEDRRRFSAEGELKPEHRGAEPPAAAAAPPPSPAATSRPPVAEPVRSPMPADDLPGEMTFATFMVGLSTQALLHLGEIVDPQGEQAGVDLGAAQQLIDIVGMLKEKTRGNLDRDEESLIDAILFELRMKYVERLR